MNSSGRRVLAVVAIGLILIVAAGIGGYAGASRAQTTYRSTATVVVIPPGAGNPNATLNPFVNLDSNMAQLALVLETAINSPDTSHRFKPPASVTSFEASVVPDSSRQNASNTPQIALSVSGTDPDDTRWGAEQLIKYSRALLIAMQTRAGVQKPAFADQQVVVPPLIGRVAESSHVRATLVSGAIGLVIAAAAVVLTLASLRWWRAASARSRRAGSAEVDEAGELADRNAHRDHESIKS